MIRTLLKPLSFLPALLLMYMIFSFSSQTGEISGQFSYKVSHKIVETVDYVFDGNLQDWEVDDWANRINFITRKLAHMTEYFALAVAVSFPLYVYGLHGILLMLIAGIICVGFACGDEYHQSFVAGRSPSVRDVLIDSFGVFWGIVLVRIVGWTGRKTIFRPKKAKKQKYVQEEYYEVPKEPYFRRKTKQKQYFSDDYNAQWGAPPYDYQNQEMRPHPSEYYQRPEPQYQVPPQWEQQPTRGSYDHPNNDGGYAPDPAPEKKGFFKRKKTTPVSPYENNVPYPYPPVPPYGNQEEDTYWQPPQEEDSVVPPSDSFNKSDEKDWFFDDLY